MSSNKHAAVAFGEVSCCDFVALGKSNTSETHSADILESRKGCSLDFT